MAYYSWSCTDLGGVTLYAAEKMLNPDITQDQYFSMVDRAWGYNIVDYFDSAIRSALQQGQDYSTGFIKLARMKIGGTLENLYFMWIAEVSGSNHTVTIRYGRGDGSSLAHYETLTYSEADYTSMPGYQKYVYFVYAYNRSSYIYEGMPHYDGSIRLYMVFGAVDKMAGTWHEPDTTYRYGHMTYQAAGVGALSDIPGGTIACASDNAESNSQQSEAVGFTYYAESWGGTNAQLCDYNGNNESGTNPYDEDPNENDPGGPSGPGGGDGDHQGHYDPIPIPGLPTIGPNSAGFVYMLRLQQTEMARFARNLLAPNWWNELKNFFADPMDFICGIMIVPYIPTSQHRVYPKFGENTFDTAFDQVYQQYTAIDCGSIAVNKYFGSCFDYNPYHKLLLWLPYIGYRELDPDEFVGKAIHVVYHCDCLTGDCVAFVSSIAGSGYDVPFERVVAQYSGNCGVRVPFGTQSFDSAIQASVQLLGGAVGLIAGGAGGAAIAAGEISASQIANSVAGSTIQAVNGGKISTERSGTAGATAGYLSVQKPYLLRTVMQQSLPENYKALEGYPSNIAGPLRLFSGFAGVESINLNGIAATKDELDEISALLRGGVFI